METNTNNGTKKLFFAILLDEPARTFAAQTQATTRDQFATESMRAYRWVSPADMHLTLFYLGDQSVDDIPTIITCAQRIAAANSAFTAKFHGLGRFPYRGQARVLWLGGIDPLDLHMRGLAQQLREGLKEFATDEKVFTPHITLAYVRPSADKQELSTVMAHSQDDPRIATPHMMMVRQFTLMESIPDGNMRDAAESRYTLVHSFLLQ